MDTNFHSTTLQVLNEQRSNLFDVIGCEGVR